MKKYLFVIVILFISKSALSDGCPSWITQTQKFPACPANSQLLDETYPLVGLVVADTLPNPIAPGGPDYAVSVVKAALQANPEKPPAILLPVYPATYERLVKEVSEMASSPEQRKLWLSALKPVDPVLRYPWQQDYFVSTTTPAGGVKFNPIQNYGGFQGFRLSAERDTSKLAEAGADCNFSEGSLVTNTDGDKTLDSLAGGNVQALPGGVCILGSSRFKNDDDWKSYAGRYCQNPEKNAIKVSTSWLQIGHADEVIKTLPSPNGKAPCNFAVGIASPKKAIEVLSKDPDSYFYSTQAHTDNPQGEEGAAREAFTHQQRFHTGAWALSEGCKSLQSDPRKIDLPFEDTPENSRRSSKINWKLSFLPQAEAGFYVYKCTPVDRYTYNNSNSTQIPDQPPTQLAYTNKMVVDMVRGYTDLRDFNLLVQKEMDSLKTDVTKKMTERFPGCKIKIVDLPQLFFGKVAKAEDGSKTLVKNSGLALLPNLSNAIAADKTVISSEPENASIKNYIDGEYKKLGLKTSYIDTFEFHVQEGNLHCATHEIRKCSPLKKP